MKPKTVRTIEILEVIKVIGHGKLKKKIKLNQIVEHVYVVAHNEDVSNLEKALATEKFLSTVVRGPYTDQEKTFSLQMRCLVNHKNVWERAATHKGFIIVVEADFVPVKGFGQLPVPFDPYFHPDAFGYLYAGGPVLYHIDELGFSYGHACTTVAYLIGPRAAAALLQFFEEEMSKGDLGCYRAWDTYISIKLRWEKGIRCYLPYRQYGEHGGVANPEHGMNNIRTWHQADILYGPLYFLPDYARGSVMRYKLIRIRGYLRGWYRLLVGKLLETPSWRKNPQKLELLKYGLFRLIFMGKINK